MLLRRLATAALLLATSAGLASSALETPTTSQKHPAPKAANGEIKRAPVAKPFKTKSKGHKSKSSAKTTAAKASSNKSTSTTVPTQTTTHATATLRAASLTKISTREAITDRVMHSLATPRLGIENPHALAAFFEQLHQLEIDPKSQLVRVIQFGDSHTAADVFTGALRTLFQSKFGDGGAGFSFAGYPFAGYRIHGTHRAQSTGWTVLGTHLNDIGDGMVGSFAEGSIAAPLETQDPPPGSYWVHTSISPRGLCEASFAAGGASLAREPLVLGVTGATAPLVLALRDDCARLVPWMWYPAKG